MKPEFYRKEWQLLQQSPNVESLKLLANRISHSFIDRHFYSDVFEAEYIDLLCEMATFSEDDTLTQPAASALFGVVVEQLCDDFEELQTETYNRLMAHVINNIRSHKAGTKISKRLNEFGIVNQQQLYDRIESIRANSDQRRAPTPPKKVLILSRITVGADVAVSSVFCQKIAHQFPKAEIVLIGPEKLAQLYQSNDRVRIKPLSYTRRGNLVERFNSWLTLADIVADETEGLNAGDVLLFDPDSRLSQLGVLPLIESEYYYFFNSRGKDSYPKKIPIAELANFWLDAVLGPGPFLYPKVWPAITNLEKAKQALGPLQEAADHQIITINLGAGGNPRKQLPEIFEQKLVLSLISQANTTIFLDMGFGDAENSRNQRILSAAKSQGFTTLSCQFNDIETCLHQDTNNAIVGVYTEIGEIASLISRSSEFIGYDSACQHIAAALEVPTYTIFAGSNNVSFIRRWTACGCNTSEVIFVDNIKPLPDEDLDVIVERLMDRRS